MMQCYFFLFFPRPPCFFPGVFLSTLSSLDSRSLKGLPLGARSKRDPPLETGLEFTVEGEGESIEGRGAFLRGAATRVEREARGVDMGGTAVFVFGVGDPSIPPPFPFFLVLLLKPTSSPSSPTVVLFFVFFRVEGG